MLIIYPNLNILDIDKGQYILWRTISKQLLLLLKLCKPYMYFRIETLLFKGHLTQ